MGTVRSIRSKKSFMEVLATFGIYEMPEKRNLYYFNGAFWSEPQNWEEFLQEITRAKASLVMVERLQERIKEDIAPKELEKLKNRLNYHMTEYYDIMWDLYYCYMNDRDIADFLIYDKEDRQKNYTFRGKCYY